jgi:hypothetical protein
MTLLYLVLSCTILLFPVLPFIVIREQEKSIEEEREGGQYHEKE